MQTISASDLAGNTREVLDKLANRGETMTIKRNHALIAKIVPAQPVMTAAQALAGLPMPMLTAGDNRSHASGNDSW